MAVTAASIKTDHEEFDSLTDAVVTSYIAKAILMHDAEVWGDRLDLGVEWKTCDLLARSPFGRDLRLKKEGSVTIYQAEWQRLRDSVGGAWRVYP